MTKPCVYWVRYQRAQRTGGFKEGLFEYSWHLDSNSYSDLQKTLNDGSAYRSPAKAKKIWSELGWELVVLRFYAAKAWPKSLPQSVEHIIQLIKVLYFYSCAVRLKFPRYAVAEARADSDSKLTDQFPHVNSIDGFESWMEQGREQGRQSFWADTTKAAAIICDELEKKHPDIVFPGIWNYQNGSIVRVCFGTCVRRSTCQIPSIPRHIGTKEAGNGELLGKL